MSTDDAFQWLQQGNSGGELQAKASVEEFYYDRIERVAQIQQFFETDWENAESLTDFFDG